LSQVNNNILGENSPNLFTLVLEAHEKLCILFSSTCKFSSHVRGHLFGAKVVGGADSG
jgi:hypothetical protein